MFFRGYMQARLRAHWSPPVAVLASSTAFAVLHVDVSAVHMVLALALGVYLGFVAELSGSTLPSIVCHVVNNSVFTVVTALTGTIDDVRMNAILLGASVLLFLASGGFLMRRLPRAVA